MCRGKEQANLKIKSMISRGRFVMCCVEIILQTEPSRTPSSFETCCISSFSLWAQKNGYGIQMRESGLWKVDGKRVSEPSWVSHATTVTTTKISVITLRRARLWGCYTVRPHPRSNERFPFWEELRMATATHAGGIVPLVQTSTGKNSKVEENW